MIIRKKKARTPKVRTYKLLVYEPSWDGHHTEFLLHIVRAKLALGGPILIVCHPGSKEILEGNFSVAAGGIDICYISELDCSRLEEAFGNSRKRGRVEWSILQSWSAEVRAENYLLMHLNPMQLEMVLRKRWASDSKISGILFNPVPLTFRAVCTGNIVMILRKLVLLYLIVSDERCNRIFLLNDMWTTERLNFIMSARRRVFRCIPDPVCATPIARELFHDVKAVKGKVDFLLFGSMDRRKGALVLLDALERLNPAIRAQVRVKIAGHFTDQAFYNEVHQRIHALSPSHVSELILRDHYYSGVEMAEEISSADVLLLPYLESNSSSGILGHAAYYRKPVIASSSGVIAALVREYEMGLLVKPGHCEELAAAIEHCVNDGLSINQAKAERFCSERTPSAFAGRILLDSIGWKQVDGEII